MRQFFNCLDNLFVAFKGAAGGAWTVARLVWRLAVRNKWLMGGLAVGFFGHRFGEWLMPKFVGPKAFGPAETFTWTLFGTMIVIVAGFVVFLVGLASVAAFKRLRQELVWAKDAWATLCEEQSWDLLAVFRPDPQPRQTAWPPPPPLSTGERAFVVSASAEAAAAAQRIIDELDRRRLANTSNPEALSTRLLGEPCPHCQGSGRIPAKPEFPPNRLMSEGAWAITDEPVRPADRHPTEEI